MTRSEVPWMRFNQPWQGLSGVWVCCYVSLTLLVSTVSQAVRLLMDHSQMRVGLGHDVHRLVAGRKLVLGGVAVEFDRGLFGHSDADVLLHAVIDALLGAAGLGDIGGRFPDTDPRWAQADSTELLRDVVNAIRKIRWQVVNLDCTIFAERPKLAPYKQAIRRRLAELLMVPDDQVNVKAKTGEQLGPIGRGEAIAADAIVLLSREANTDDPAPSRGELQ